MYADTLCCTTYLWRSGRGGQCTGLKIQRFWFDSRGLHNMKKRYQYWSKDGIVWTDWFDWDGPEMPSPIKKLKVEYKD